MPAVGPVVTNDDLLCGALTLLEWHPACEKTVPAFCRNYSFRTWPWSSNWKEICWRWWCCFG